MNSIYITVTNSSNMTLLINLSPYKDDTLVTYKCHNLIQNDAMSLHTNESQHHSVSLQRCNASNTPSRALKWVSLQVSLNINESRYNVVMWCTYCTMGGLKMSLLTNESPYRWDEENHWYLDSFTMRYIDIQTHLSYQIETHWYCVSSYDSFIIW